MQQRTHSTIPQHFRVNNVSMIYKMFAKSADELMIEQFSLSVLNVDLYSALS